MSLKLKVLLYLFGSFNNSHIKIMCNVLKTLAIKFKY